MSWIQFFSTETKRNSHRKRSRQHNLHRQIAWKAAPNTPNPGQFSGTVTRHCPASVTPVGRRIGDPAAFPVFGGPHNNVRASGKPAKTNLARNQPHCKNLVSLQIVQSAPVAPLRPPGKHFVHLYPINIHFPVFAVNSPGFEKGLTKIECCCI